MSSPLSPPSPATPAPARAAGLRAARTTRVLAAVLLAALMVLCVGWELSWAPTVAGGSWVLAAKALPLLLPWPGVLRLRMYTYRWLSLLVWLYVTEGLVRASADPPPARWLAMTEVALALALFAACVLHIRLRQRHARHPSVNAATDAAYR